MTSSGNAGKISPQGCQKVKIDSDILFLLLLAVNEVRSSRHVLNMDVFFAELQWNPR